MKFTGTRRSLLITGSVAVLLAISTEARPDRKGEELGGPVNGLSQIELTNFYEFKALFAKNFTPESGLGPVYNAQSCAECHKSPTIGGSSGSAFASLGCMRIGKLSEKSVFRKFKKQDALAGVYGVDVDPMVEAGGPVVARYSISQKFPAFSKLAFAAGKVPKQAEFLSIRQATPLYGLGLILAIPDSSLLAIREQQKKILGVTNAGRQAALPRHFTPDTEYGRFGWKGQHNSLVSFAVEAMNFEMGLTTPFNPHAKTTTGMGNMTAQQKECLPVDPNDQEGKLALKLAYYMALLAPPPAKAAPDKDEREGKLVFEQLGCAVCHVAEFRTKAKVMLPDPEGAIPDAPAMEKRYGQFWYLQDKCRVKFVEVKALENRVIYPYSDFLVHKMGLPLADGLPQGAAGGDYWRTTPLWGLRFRTHYLHDGRTTNLTSAILAHAGQAAPAVKRFAALDSVERNKLLRFLKSL